MADKDFKVKSGLSMGTPLPASMGGTGQTSTTNALNAMLPVQTSNSGKYLTTDGTNTSWGTVSTSPTIVQWKKTMSGGETSLSGTDDNSVALSYSVGREMLFINGVLQVRGSDYTASNGTTITGLSALSANDIVAMWSFS